ncbi:MAG: ankyrin repeat domain-containing protein [Bacteroidota bacterium]
MNTRDTKLFNCYTQGQRSAARVLFIVWLLTSCSPDTTLAAPEGTAGAMVSATATSSPDQSAPGALALPPASGPAMEHALQQRMSQRAVLDKGRDLLRTSSQVTPVGEHLSFQARGGEQVRFQYEAGQWRAEVSSHMGAFSRRAVFPVVCSLGEDVASSLEVLSRYPSWYSQRQIHVIDRNVVPTLGEAVYLGELGLKGGGGGETSGSVQAMIDDDLIREAGWGSLEKVQDLLKKGANIEAKSKSSEGRTPLLIAAKRGRLEVVQRLKELGADIEAKDDKLGVTPLYFAAYNGCLEVVRYLAGVGANIEVKENSRGATVFHAAAQQGRLELMKCLKELGADINTRNDHDATPLYIAAYNGCLEAVRYLVGVGANIEAKESTIGATPLSGAAQEGHLAVVQYLVEQKAEIEAKSHIGSTPLWAAAHEGKLDVVKYLVEQGAEIEVRSDGGIIPLQVAAQNGHQEVVRYLVEHGANIEVRQEGTRATPLFSASQEGQMGVVQYLVEQRADIEAKNHTGSTPLWVAAHKGKLDVVKYLVEQGADIRARDCSDVTPLQAAARNGHQEVVAYLKRQDDNIRWANMLDEDDYILLRTMLQNNQISSNERIEKGGIRRPLLHWACCEGKPKLVAELLYGRAEQRVGNLGDLTGIERIAVTSSDLLVDIETPDANGFTPLHYAARGGYREIVEILVEYKEIIKENSVEPGIPLKYTEYVDSIVMYVNRPTNPGGQTALQLAKVHRRDEVEAYLKSIRKRGIYYCLGCANYSPVSGVTVSICGSGGGVQMDRAADVMPKNRLFNKYRVWTGVMQQRVRS